MWKFCGNAQFPRVNRARLCGNWAFPQNFHTRKLGEVMVFYTMKPNSSWTVFWEFSRVFQVYVLWNFKIRTVLTPKFRLFIGDLKHDIMHQVILRMMKILKVSEFRDHKKCFFLYLHDTFKVNLGFKASTQL